MSPRLALCVALLSATAATAQVGPEIAYAKKADRGARAEVYLVNPNGTGQILLYRGRAGSEIGHVDIKPGGGELAIEEHRRTRSLRETASAIKIINYDAAGSVIGSVRTLQLSCRTGSLDYHPTDGSLLFRNCSTPKRIERLNTTTLSHSDLGLNHDAFIASWLDATHLLYYTNPATPADRKFYTVSTGALASPTEVLAHPSAGSLDTSTAGDKGLWSFGSERIDLLTISPPGIAEFQRPGGKGHFSPDDQFVAYITAPAPGQFILIRRFDGAGSPTNLAGEGAFTALDWRN